MYNRNEINNCHYRDCETTSNNLSRRGKEITVMPILPQGKIQGIFELNKKIGRSLEKIFKKIFRDDLFIFGCAKALTLAAVLSTGIISESRAEIASGDDCGTNCIWSITDTGVLIIKGTASGAQTGAYIRVNYKNTPFTPILPWTPNENQITAVVFDGIQTNDAYGMGVFLNDMDTIVFKEASISEYNNHGIANKATFLDENTSINDYLLANNLGCASGYIMENNLCRAIKTNCPADKFSVGGECLPKRYTPAEISQLVGESNTILLYYK